LSFYVAGVLPAASWIGVANVILASFRQAYSPPGMLGRVTATMRFLTVGTNPLGALLGGGLAAVIGIRGRSGSFSASPRFRGRCCSRATSPGTGTCPPSR
jgi:hypothetical protein